MTWQDIKRKLTSRKLWTAVCSFATLIVVALGYSETTATQVTALIMAGATVVAYIIGEGMTDAANVAYTGAAVVRKDDEIDGNG